MSVMDVGLSETLPLVNGLLVGSTAAAVLTFPSKLDRTSLSSAHQACLFDVFSSDINTDHIEHDIFPKQVPPN